MTRYEVALRIESMEYDATEFAHHHAEELKEIGFEPVYFERTGEVVLLQEVDEE